MSAPPDKELAAYPKLVTLHTIRAHKLQSIKRHLHQLRSHSLPFKNYIWSETWRKNIGRERDLTNIKYGGIETYDPCRCRSRLMKSLAMSDTEEKQSESNSQSQLLTFLSVCSSVSPANGDRPLSL